MSELRDFDFVAEQRVCGKEGRLCMAVVGGGEKSIQKDSTAGYGKEIGSFGVGQEGRLVQVKAGRAKRVVRFVKDCSLSS
jgi:hypothetical protein